MITAATIDNIIEALDKLTDEQYEQHMEAFAARQPVLIAYLFNDESFHLLSEDEKGYLQYLAFIIWMSVEKTNGEVPAVSEDDIGEAEEHNYELLENSQARSFRQRLDPFFENYPEEDLLAFAEEAVLEDEDDPDSLVTHEGREQIFVALKTVIDVLS